MRKTETAVFKSNAAGSTIMVRGMTEPTAVDMTDRLTRDNVVGLFKKILMQNHKKAAHKHG